MTSMEKTDALVGMEDVRRETAARLAAIDVCDDGLDSHGRLSAICKAIYAPPFGWTVGSCAALRDRLLWMLGGDTIPDGVPGERQGLSAGEVIVRELSLGQITHAEAIARINALAD